MFLEEEDYSPVGKKLWNIPSSVCNRGVDELRELLLSSCDVGQFTCNDGVCIDIVNRCDGVKHCEDLSDEESCQLIKVDPKKYLKDKPPPSGSTLPVELSSNIKVILDINEVASYIYLQFELILTWFDERVKYYNLKLDMNMNTLIFDETQAVWVPSIIFDNTEDQIKSRNDRKSVIKVSKISNGTFNDDGLLSEDIDIYEGSDNPLIMSRVYNVKFICDYDMQWYPFDSQTCHMDFKLEENMKNFLSLVTGTQEYLGPKELTQYFVKSSDILYYQADQVKGVRISITLGRRLLGTFLTVYFPTVLLNVIGHCTNFFKDFFFEAVVTVNLTSMLVLVTMFISVSNNLPKTSYIKMMDIWLIFNLLLPFMEVLVHTYMDLLRNDEEREVNHHGSAVKPLENTDVAITNVLDRSQITPVLPQNKNVRSEDLISRQEDTQVAALRNHYQNLKNDETEEKQRKLKLVRKFLLFYNPIGALTFVFAYWFIGLRHAEYI